MTRKIKNDALKHRQARKETKVSKSNGTFKKLGKSYQPPDLSRFKSKIVTSLKNQSADRSTIVKALENESSKLDISRLLEDDDELNDQVDELSDIQQEPTETPRDRTQTHKYLKEVKKLVEKCDIVLEILDARDPMACRCKAMERKILSLGHKKIVLVLNKIDLVPSENAIAWQTYFRRQFPVVMFKANLQQQQNHLASFNLYNKSITENSQFAERLLKTTKAIGADQLLQLIKQLSKVDGKNRSVTVGLIGYPNVGKSSVINSLKRMKTCDVSSIPGCTKNLKQIKLDSEVTLVDCPGVIFQRDLTKNQLILQNSTRADQDLEEVITAILERVAIAEIIKLYDIEPYTSTTDFLAKICRRKGKLGKGGIPEMKQGAKLIIDDWNTGKITYFTYPPFAEQRNQQAQMLLE